VVDQHPTVDQVTRALLSEPGNSAIATPETEMQLREFVARWPSGRAEEVLAKRRRWPAIRVFGAGDMVYVLYFDGGGVLQDYVLLGK
jgi:hypothetical protein